MFTNISFANFYHIMTFHQFRCTTTHEGIAYGKQ